MLDRSTRCAMCCWTQQLNKGCFACHREGMKSVWVLLCSSRRPPINICPPEKTAPNDERDVRTNLHMHARKASYKTMSLLSTSFDCSEIFPYRSHHSPVVLLLSPPHLQRSARTHRLLLPLKVRTNCSPGLGHETDTGQCNSHGAWVLLVCA